MDRLKKSYQFTDINDSSGSVFFNGMNSIEKCAFLLKERGDADDSYE